MAAGEPKKIERLISIFQQLTGVKFDRIKYQHRLMIQKITYILKWKNDLFDYNFNWYIRGPYSPKLTLEEYDYREPETNQINKEDEQNASFICDLIGKIDDNELELYASIIYLIKERRIMDLDTLYSTIHDSKPWFDKEDVKEAFEKINQKFFT
jgi:hypothetical protein